MALALGLSVLFIFLELSFWFGPLSISISFLIVVALLSSIRPEKVEQHDSGGMSIPQEKIVLDRILAEHRRVESHPLFNEYINDGSATDTMSPDGRQKGFVQWIIKREALLSESQAQ